MPIYYCKGGADRGVCDYEEERDGPWKDRCPGCDRIYDCEVRRDGGDERAASRLAAQSLKPRPRILTGIAGLDRVLGGGIVPGSTVMLAGRHGQGKSTLSLWACINIARGGDVALYVSGEENPEDVVEMAQRQGAFDDFDEEQRTALLQHFLLVRKEDNVFAIAEMIERHKPKLTVVDSVQVVQSPECKADYGENAQVKAVMNHLTARGKDLRRSIIAISQVNNEGNMAGGTAGQHSCDATFQFNAFFPEGAEDDEDGENAVNWRVLECDGKNRKGDPNEVAFFEFLPGSHPKTPGRMVELAPRKKSEKIVDANGRPAETTVPKGRLRLVDED